jgi:hypothetical protein
MLYHVMSLKFTVSIMQCFYLCSNVLSLDKGTWEFNERVVKVIDFKPLAPHHCRFKSRKGRTELLMLFELVV